MSVCLHLCAFMDTQYASVCKHMCVFVPEHTEECAFLNHYLHILHLFTRPNGQFDLILCMRHFSEKLQYIVSEIIFCYRHYFGTSCSFGVHAMLPCVILNQISVKSRRQTGITLESKPRTAFVFFTFIFSVIWWMLHYFGKYGIMICLKHVKKQTKNMMRMWLSVDRGEPCKIKRINRIFWFYITRWKDQLI